MKSKLTILLIILIGGLIYGSTSKKTGETMEFSQPVRADFLDAQVHAVPASPYVLVDDRQSQKIKAYLESKGSPLSLYAGVFAWCGAKYGIDPALLVGISRIESSYGVHYPKATNNPFGLSGGGHLIRFPSLVHSIDYLGKTIAEERYYRKWQETGEISDLAVVFCPPNSKHWTDVVTQTIKEIEEL